MLFELRQYQARPGQRDRMVRFMEEVIFPFQVSKGAVVVASFVGEEDDDSFVWIRRFDDEAHRQKVYEAIYESDRWKNEIVPQVQEMNMRENAKITRLVPTPTSVIR